MPKKPKSEKVPKAMQPSFQSIAELTDEFSKKQRYRCQAYTIDKDEISITEI